VDKPLISQFVVTEEKWVTFIHVKRAHIHTSIYTIALAHLFNTSDYLSRQVECTLAIVW